MTPGQSLSDGAAGIALLHLETSDWPAARQALSLAAVDGVSIADGASLYFGAPALAFVLATSTHPGTDGARATTATGATMVARRQLEAAHRRIDRQTLPHYREYDLINGLTGVGVVLRRLGDHDLLRQVLEYLVRLTEPVNGLPGWWCSNGPSRDLPPPPGGHANHGIAHGITGPLALLALTLRDGITVTGQHEAIARICLWLDAWQQTTDGAAWWPETITIDNLANRTCSQHRPGRPSWCYGTPGIARTMQIAAIATGQPERQATAELALAASLDDEHLNLLTDAGICHGVAGTYQTAFRAATDSTTTAIADRLPVLAARLAAASTSDAGFLTGDAGASLTALTALTNTPPQTGWDTCLLIA
ncbi:lanthionine synthetase C family protein [Longispora sp. NPDC051575]|uniref:lanthionine synthetase C family protein n=1 Tax=Longispora sp. NPDC051575 TaxID=3154943 RepID=UPI0034324F80